MSQSTVALSKDIYLQQCFKMFVADIKCPQHGTIINIITVFITVQWSTGHVTDFQIRGPTAPKLLSPKLWCVRGTAHMLPCSGYSSIYFIF